MAMLKTVKINGEPVDVASIADFETSIEEPRSATVFLKDGTTLRTEDPDEVEELVDVLTDNTVF